MIFIKKTIVLASYKDILMSRGDKGSQRQASLKQYFRQKFRESDKNKQSKKQIETNKHQEKEQKLEHLGDQKQVNTIQKNKIHHLPPINYEPKKTIKPQQISQKPPTRTNQNNQQKFDNSLQKMDFCIEVFQIQRSKRASAAKNTPKPETPLKNKLKKQSELLRPETQLKKTERSPKDKIASPSNTPLSHKSRKSPRMKAQQLIQPSSQEPRSSRSRKKRPAQFTTKNLQQQLKKMMLQDHSPDQSQQSSVLNQEKEKVQLTNQATQRKQKTRKNKANKKNQRNQYIFQDIQSIPQQSKLIYPLHLNKSQAIQQQKFKDRFAQTDISHYCGTRVTIISDRFITNQLGQQQYQYVVECNMIQRTYSQQQIQELWPLALIQYFQKTIQITGGSIF